MIELDSVSMDYSGVLAVEKVSMEVKKGEVVGLLGPNGAGKSTIMKILATQIHPTGGKALVSGHDVVTEPIEVRKALGYLPEQAPLYDDMEVREYLDFVARGRGLAGLDARRRPGWVKEVCGLGATWCRPIGELSKGYRQRVGLAQALVHDPEVLILDEPTSGLDPIQIIEIRKLVRDLAATKALLFSTHILQEITAVSDRIVVISHGKVIARGTEAELKTRFGGGLRVRARFEAQSDPVEVLRREEGIRVVESRAEGDNRWSLLVQGDVDALELLSHRAHEQGWRVLELAREEADLEDVFTQIVRKAA